MLASLMLTARLERYTLPWPNLLFWPSCSWDGVKPFLPASLDWLWDSMFKLHQPSRVMRPAGSYLPKPSLSIGGIDRLAAAANHVAAPIGTVLFRIFVHPYQVRSSHSTHQSASVQRGQVSLKLWTMAHTAGAVRWQLV